MSNIRNGEGEWRLVRMRRGGSSDGLPAQDSFREKNTAMALNS